MHGPLYRVIERCQGQMLWATLRSRIFFTVCRAVKFHGTERHVQWFSIDPILVSAVIPTRNRPELVMTAVLSTLHQSHTSIEVIVVIDGEDQATEKLLAGFEDARLQVIPLAVNVGGSEARNIGVRTANGEWIAFLDDDDEWFPHKIAMQLEAAGASEAAFPVVSSRLTVRAGAGFRRTTAPLRSREAAQRTSVLPK
jgi:cellulose synthase/poly-beta-1,6-N-acetylglucosamine synthase-like glycosyltransferase